MNPTGASFQHVATDVKELPNLVGAVAGNTGRRVIAGIAFPLVGASRLAPCHQDGT
jgi:hypothetical protein